MEESNEEIKDGYTQCMNLFNCALLGNDTCVQEILLTREFMESSPLYTLYYNFIKAKAGERMDLRNIHKIIDTIVKKNGYDINTDGFVWEKDNPTPLHYYKSLMNMYLLYEEDDKNEIQASRDFLLLVLLSYPQFEKNKIVKYKDEREDGNPYIFLIFKKVLLQEIELGRDKDPRSLTFLQRLGLVYGFDFELMNTNGQNLLEYLQDFKIRLESSSGFSSSIPSIIDDAIDIARQAIRKQQESWGSRAGESYTFTSITTTPATEVWESLRKKPRQPVIIRPPRRQQASSSSSSPSPLPSFRIGEKRAMGDENPQIEFSFSSASSSGSSGSSFGSKRIRDEFGGASESKEDNFSKDDNFIDRMFFYFC